MRLSWRPKREAKRLETPHSDRDRRRRRAGVGRRAGSDGRRKAGAGDEGGDAAFVQADFSFSADPKRVVDQSVAIYGGVDFVFNNVGIQPRTSYTNAEDTTE